GVGAKLKDAALVFDARRLQLLLGLANCGDFRLGVDDAGDRVVIYVAIAGDNVLDAGHALVLGLVRQHRPTDGVADGVDARRAGLEVLVDADAAAVVGLDADRVETHIGGVRHAADREQNPVTLDRLGAFALDDAGFAFHTGGCHATAEMKLDAL